jgi:hypothetical protein
VANSLCAAFEIELWEKSQIKTDFNAEDLDNELRKEFSKPEGSPTTKTQAIYYLQSKGIYDNISGSRVKLFNKGKLSFKQLKDFIELYVIVISIWYCKKNIRDGIAFITDIDINKTHSVVIVGYDKEKGFEILDSNFKKTYFISEFQLNTIFKTAYILKVINKQTMPKMEILKQGDNRWNRFTIGKTKFTLGRWGCTITSLCMMLSKFTLAYPMPDAAAKQWKFDSSGRIIWKTTDFQFAKFIWRYAYNNVTAIEKYGNDPNKGVIVEVDNYHWCCVNRVVGGKPVLYDPLTGEELLDYRKRYKRITKTVCFDKIV